MAYTLSDGSVFNKRHKIAKSTDTYISGNLSDFTLLVKIDSNARWNDFWANVDSTEGYVQFTDSGGETVQKFEIEDWDTTNSEAIFWVKASSALAAADTELYLYFDYVSGGSPPFDDKENAWDGSTRGNWLLNEDKAEGAFDDSTSNNNNLTNSGSTSVAGEVGKARHYDGIDDRDYAGNAASLNITGALTLDFWLNLDVAVGLQPTDYPVIIEKGSGIWGSRNYGVYLEKAADKIDFAGANPESDDHRFNVVVTSASTYLGTGVWHHICAVWDGSDAYLYIDNVQRGTDSGSGDLYQNTEPLNFGESGVYNIHYRLDGVRLSAGGRTADWRTLTYEDIDNADDWTTYQTLSAMEPAATGKPYYYRNFVQGG